ncbi:MAG TPA: hypothetical protein VGC59_16865 [Solirubrobacteraceae bacterium]|jgi:hypothetical protein
MNASRRVAAVLSGLAMAGAISSGPALAAVAQGDSAAGALSAATNPSQGFCDPSEDGDLQHGGDGHLYRCTHIEGLGWYWMPA